MTPRALARAAAAVLVHPSLWWVGLRQLVTLAAPGWWHRPPFLPLPAPGYLRFRMETVYGGSGDAPIEPEDLLDYLRWCRDVPK